MDPHYVDLVKQWVKYDNVILRNADDVREAKERAKEIEERVADAVERKKEIETEIIEYVKGNKLETMQLKISDGVITFAKKTTQKPISQKFLKEILIKYNEENQDNQIPQNKLFEFIINNIDKKVEFSINRHIKDASA